MPVTTPVTLSCLPQAPPELRVELSKLFNSLDYLNATQILEVERAYQFSAAAHQGQTRRTGEPYVLHPVAVTRILADMRVDHYSLMAALLHDVIEDTDVVKSALAWEFGDQVAELVDGLSKLTQIDSKTRAAQAANSQKMLLAVAQDIRVILIKLADRLHNVRTLAALRPEQKFRIAKETLEIYAPIAYRLGLNHLRQELEEWSFLYYRPWRHRCLKRALEKIQAEQQPTMCSIKAAVAARLHQLHLTARWVSREKPLYSIYRKMQEKKVSLKQLDKIFVFRLVSDSIDTCYRLLGLVHSLYKPIPGRFKDYIALPKANGYQSLHTVVLGPNGLQIEVQLRTENMERLAESDIAAHWLYRSDAEPVSAAQRQAAVWVQNLLDMQQGSENPLEFLEDVRLDLFPDEVYVFTPQGHILALPHGATVVDFAYALHSDLGNTCVAGRVDGRLVPLSTALHSGQTVEVIQADNAHPSDAWLGFVVTGRARAKVRAYVKQMRTRDAVPVGLRLLKSALLERQLPWERVDPGCLFTLLTEIGLVTLEDLFRQIGLGQRLPQWVAQRLTDAPLLPRVDEATAAGEHPVGQLALCGDEGAAVAYCSNCRPIHGDSVVGLVVQGSGLTVHRQDCRALVERRHLRLPRIELVWAEAQLALPTEIRLNVSNQPGVLADVSRVIACNGTNIEAVKTELQDDVIAVLNFLLIIRNQCHLREILHQIALIPQVRQVSRVEG